MSDRVFDAVNVIGDALKGLAREEQAKVLQGVSLMLGLNEPIAPVSISTANGLVKRRSVAEFVNERRPANAKEMMLTLSVYLHQVEGKDAFAASDLKPLFGKARLKFSPAHFARDFGKAIAAGWIQDNEGSYYVTQAGERAAEELLARTNVNG